MARGLDLGIDGKKAIICASSRGLGKACALALAEAGVEVTMNGRNQATLDQAVAEVAQKSGGKITAAAGDVTTSEGRAALLRLCPEPDILVNNAAGPAPGDFRDWGEAQWVDALRGNMLTPIELIRATIDSMRRKKWGRIINITSGAVKAPLPLLGLSNGARAGLTGFIAGLAREVAKDGVTINNILPGPFDTDRLRGYLTAVAKKNGTDLATVMKQTGDANPAGRIGQPDEFGAACAFLASARAGYINGQNLLLDGGAYPGVF